MLMDLDFRINVFFVNATCTWKITRFLTRFSFSLGIEQWQGQLIVFVHALYLSISSSPNLTLECRPRRVAAFQVNKKRRLL